MTSDKAREDVHYVHFQLLLTMENQGDVKSALVKWFVTWHLRSYNSQIEQIWYQDFAGAQNSRLSTPGT